MKAMQGRDRYRKEVIKVSSLKNDIKVQNLYDKKTTKMLYDKFMPCWYFLRFG